MLNFFLRRLAIILLALVVVNFISFSYAHIALRVQQAQNPFGSAAAEDKPPIFALYAAYVQSLLRGETGQMPVGVNTSVLETVAKAASASVGLLALVFVVSVGAGVGLGVGAVRVNPGRVSAWMLPLASVGLALPGFYIGIAGVSLLVWGVLHTGPGTSPLLPLQGFGWDAHMVLPVLALVLRPMVQVAQVTAGLLAEELNKPYIVAARSRGNTWARARWRHAFRNSLAPVVLTVAGSFRLLVGELILVEWLFAWPGLGQLLARTLVPPSIAGPGALQDVSIYFLHPPLVAALLTAFTALFLIVDAFITAWVSQLDPRARAGEGGGK